MSTHTQRSASSGAGLGPAKRSFAASHVADRAEAIALARDAGVGTEPRDDVRDDA